MTLHAQSSGSRPVRAAAGARFARVILSPRDAFAQVVANPDWLEMAIFIAIVSALFNVGFLTTDVGGLAALDWQVRQIESFGILVTDRLYSQLDYGQRYVPYLAAANIFVGWPLLWALLSGVIALAFKRGSGDAVSFRQVFAVVVHSWAIFGLRAIFAAPLNYVRESIGGTTSLGVFFPMLASGSPPARMLGAIDLFTVWWLLLLAIGLSQLYRRRATSIAGWLFSIYIAGALVLAVIQTLRGGA